VGNRSVVACGHPATTDAAAAVLDEGGNAFDAALAAMCAACVAEPVLASLGGGGFLLVRPTAGNRQGGAVVYDFFPQTPGQRLAESERGFFPVHADFGGVRQEFRIGMGSVATPGVVRGLFEAHRDLGYMPLRRIVEPACALARAGIRIDALQAYMFRVIAPIFQSTPESLATFSSRKDSARLVGEGEILAIPEFADTLETLAIEGDGLFYRGEIADRIVGLCRAHGGHLVAADLDRYRVERRKPLTIRAFANTVHLNPPPSCGGILIAFALQLLQGSDLAALPFGTGAYLWRLVQVMDLTNRARLEQAIHDLEPERAVAALLDPRLVAAYRREILDRPFTTRGTTHISVLDGDGNAAALSLSNGEGCGHLIPGTGIMLNNVLGEEDINPHGLQRWPCASRLASMLAPTLALGDDGAMTVLGSGGSNRLRTAILQVLLDLMVFEMPVEEAVAMPRIHFENGRLSVEPGFRDDAVDALAPRIAEIERWREQNMFFGGVHSVRRDGKGGLSGAGDPRRGGCARIV
jgi:gamma-glutamyltranspeptidase/glutathione hydrolase